METLFRKHRILISQVSMDIVRETMQHIAWEKQLVALRGSRGVGKTTLMRQYVRQTYGVNAGEALYCVLDSLYFTNHSLLNLAEQFHMRGGRHLFLDEVHKYPTWSKEIKEIIDLYPDLKITFSGSSLLQILNADADLSRRVLSYMMEGLSFREYLHFYKGIQLPKHSLESRIENVINFIVDQELTQFCGVEIANTRKIKALLLFLAENVPYEVNIAKLSAYLELNKQTVLGYLSGLQRAELLHLLYSDTKSVTRLQKPDKIYLHNPNLFYALGQQNHIGTIRECFVVNQLAVNHSVEYGKQQGDFLVDRHITLEVGGHNKTFDQIADMPDSYVLADMLEYPIGKKLPLWIVGLMY